MVLDIILPLLSLTPKLKQILEQKTIHADVVDIIDNELSKQYPYFKLKILVEFCSQKEVTPLIEKIRKGENYEKDLSVIMKEFLKKKKYDVDEPLQMLKTFNQELEQKIVNSSSSMEKVIHRNLKNIQDNQISKENNENMLTKICEMHEMMKSMTMETKPNMDSKNIHFKEFMLIWPDNWEIVPENIKKMTDENTKNFLAKHGYSGYVSDNTKLSIRRKTKNVELVPTVNVSVSISEHANIDDLSEANAIPMIKAGYEIFDSYKNYNNRSFDWNLKIPKEVFPDFHLQDDIYQIQKYVLKNNIEFIITVTKIYENMLKKKPEILDEIASILQSFAIL